MVFFSISKEGKTLGLSVPSWKRVIIGCWWVMGIGVEEGSDGESTNWADVWGSSDNGWTLVVLFDEDIDIEEDTEGVEVVFGTGIERLNKIKILQ